MVKREFRSVLGFVSLGVLLIILLAVFYFYNHLHRIDQFLPGVRIASVPVQGCDQEQAFRLVEDWVDKKYTTEVIFIKDDYTHETNLGELCFKVDVEKMVGEIWNKEKQRNLRSKISSSRGEGSTKYPLNIDYDPQRLQKIAEEIAKNVEKKPVNATITVNNKKALIVIPGENGTSIDIKSTYEKLPKEWGDFDCLEIPIVTREEQPEIDANALKTMGELASYTTWYNTSEINRSHNLFLAANAINSTIIQPQGIFSFNQTVGERIYEKGYRDALIIVGGKFEPGAGGGVCQVSSTLYNSCLLAGLEIVERYSHGLAISYVPLGRDATVVFGLQDLRFRNNTPQPIYIGAFTEAGRLTINIYGNTDHKQNIQLSNIIDKVIDFKEQQEVDPELEPGQKIVDHEGSPGYEVRAFRTYLDNSGRVIKKEQLSTDRYRPLNTLVYIGPPAKTENITPEENTDPKQNDTDIDAEKDDDQVDEPNQLEEQVEVDEED